MKWLVGVQASIRELPVWQTGANVAAGDMDDGAEFVCRDERVLSLDSESVRFLRRRRAWNMETDICAALQVQLWDGTNALIRVSVVEWPGFKVVYDEWLVPPGGVDNVKDWLTQVSGATREIVLEKAKHTVADVIRSLKANYGPQSILVLHAATNDLKGLQLKPPTNLLDTSLLFHHPELVNNPPSLATLVTKYLPSVLDRREGHSSADDARACIELLEYLVEHGE